MFFIAPLSLVELEYHHEIRLPEKTDAQTIEFPITLAPDEEKTVIYTVHYSW